MGKYLDHQLMQLQHAVVLQALKDIKTPTLRKTHMFEVMRGLKLYAPLYQMTVEEMIYKAEDSGFIKPLSEEERDEYGIKER